MEPSDHHAHGPGLLHRQCHTHAAGSDFLTQLPSGGMDAPTTIEVLLASDSPEDLLDRVTGGHAG